MPMPEKSGQNMLTIRSRRWGAVAKAATAAAIVAVALAAAGAWWAAWQIERGRELHETAVRFALHLRAMRPAPSEADNAAGPFARACGLYVRPAEASLESAGRDSGLDFSSEPVRAWLDANVACRRALAEALSRPACDWGSDYAEGLAGLRGAEAAEVRRAARLLETGARAEAAAGRPGPALAEALLVLRLADPVCGRFTAADLTVSADVEETFVRALQGVLNSCDPAERELLRTEALIAAHLGQRPSAAGAVESEAVLARVSIGMVASGRIGTPEFAAAARARGRPGTETAGWRLAWWRWSGNLLDDARLIEHAAQQAASAMDKPWPQVLDAATALDRRAGEFPEWALAARGVFAPRFAAAAARDGQALVAMRAARLMVALRLRKLSKGDYPAGPLSVEDTPEDPFSGNAFGCRRTDTGCLLWSVGPDRRDDGGTDRKDLLFELTR